MYLPADIANRAIDAVGMSDMVIGDPQEGTRAAQIILRSYGECLRQLLRAAHWQFARKDAPLMLLADATGQTSFVGTLVVGNQFRYEYAYPTDCMRLLYVPWRRQGYGVGIPPDNIQAPITPIPGVDSGPYVGQRIRPAKFLVATDYNYPPQAGQVTWEVQSVSPQGRTVVLTNVQDAHAVYTSLVLYPSVWDSLFRAAMVAYLASEVALPLWAQKDRKFGLQVRQQQMAVVKAKVTEARLADGNETISSSDIRVDWMDARQSDGWGGSWGWGQDCGGVGGFGTGWESMALADGSVF